MLSVEENELLTKTGRGTPMGELLRRFWMPILLAEELPAALRWVRPTIERRFGWNLIVKATKRV